MINTTNDYIHNHIFTFFYKKLKKKLSTQKDVFRKQWLSKTVRGLTMTVFLHNLVKQI